jgi:hypothetical protein
MPRLNGGPIRLTLWYEKLLGTQGTNVRLLLAW